MVSYSSCVYGIMVKTFQAFGNLFLWCVHSYCYTKSTFHIFIYATNWHDNSSIHLLHIIKYPFLLSISSFSNDDARKLLLYDGIVTCMHKNKNYFGVGRGLICRVNTSNYKMIIIVYYSTINIVHRIITKSSLC